MSAFFLKTNLSLGRGPALVVTELSQFVSLDASLRRGILQRPMPRRLMGKMKQKYNAPSSLPPPPGRTAKVTDYTDDSSPRCRYCSPAHLVVRVVHGELVEGVAGIEDGLLVVAVEGGAERLQALGGEDLLVVRGRHGEVPESQTRVSFPDVDAIGVLKGGGRTKFRTSTSRGVDGREDTALECS